MNKRDLRLSIGRTLLTVSALALLAALVGVPVYLGLWQLAVYPAVIGGLILFWMYLVHSAKTDPNNALGFIDHVGGMFFALFFVGPAMLFLAVWTIYLFAHADSLVRGTAYTLAILTVLLLVLGSTIENFAAGLFVKYGPRIKKRKRSR